MNINTLSAQEIDYKSGSLPVALYPNNMRKDDGKETSYFARVVTRGTCSLEELADDLIVTGVVQGFSKEQLVKIGMAFNNAKIDRLMNGFVVDDGISRACSKIYGSFASKTEAFSSERHSIGVSFSVNAKVKKLLATLNPVIRQGNSLEPQIVAVCDVESGSSERLTRGGFLNITGSNICVVGDNESVGLYFVDVADPANEVKIPVKKIGVNTAVHVACIIPADLNIGSYRIKLVTQYSRSKVLRKEPLSCMTDARFSVGD